MKVVRNVINANMGMNVGLGGERLEEVLRMFQVFGIERG